MICRQEHDFAGDVRLKPATRPVGAHIVALVFSVQCFSVLNSPQFTQRRPIPLGTLRDWAQARREPDAAESALLRAIERDPQTV
jgi:hypothetical protein